MLTEDLRVLAGIQESVSATNPLPKYISEIQEAQKIEEQRIENSSYSVASNFNIFKTKITKIKALFEMISVIIEDDNVSTFINGIMESKYPKLKQFTEIALNDSVAQAVAYLENNLKLVEQDILSIQYINETIDEETADTYFASNLITSKGHHGIDFDLFENKDLTQKIGHKIEYGTQIISMTETLSMVKLDGKKVYSNLTRCDLKELEKKGLLL
jgi:hypothetical protein